MLYLDSPEMPDVLRHTHDTLETAAYAETDLFVSSHEAQVRRKFVVIGRAGLLRSPISRSLPTGLNTYFFLTLPQVAYFRFLFSCIFVSLHASLPSLFTFFL